MPVKLTGTTQARVNNAAAVPTLKPTPKPQTGKDLSTSPSTAPSLLVLDPIQIRVPGAGSKVISPISVQVQLAIGEAGDTIRIELYGEDGRLLVRKLLSRGNLPVGGQELQEQIEYEIPAEFENGRLVVAVDQTPGIAIAVNSIELLLQSSGTVSVKGADWQAKWIDIQQPAAAAEITGGKLTISGLTQQEAAKPLKLSLLSADGKVLGQANATIEGPADAEFKSFTGQLAFQVKQPTPAWVVVYSEASPGGAITHLASLPVDLKP